MHLAVEIESLLKWSFHFDKISCICAHLDRRTIMKKRRRIFPRCVAGLLSMIMIAASTPSMATFASDDTNGTSDTSISNHGPLVSATSMYLGHVTFTGQNNGSWRTVPGNHVRMCIAFKPVAGISYSTELSVSLYQYQNVYIGTLNCDDWSTTPDSDGYYFFVSDYFTINQYSDCQLRYIATSSGTSYDPRRVSVYAWYDYY